MKLDRGTIRALGVVSGIGFSIAGGIILGVLGGQWVDRKFSTFPWGVIAGILVGLALAFVMIYELIGELQAPNDKSDGSDHSGPRE